MKSEKHFLKKPFSFFPPRLSSRSGFTLLELLIASAIMITLVIFLGIFLQRVLNFGLYFSETFSGQQELQQASQQIIEEIHSMSVSGLGAYPIAAASGNSLTFFSDIDGNGQTEQIRYFLDGNILKKGIIEPAGNPLSYNPAEETISEEIHNIIMPFATSTIFSYYGGGYTGFETPLVFPVTTSAVQTIEVNVFAKDLNQNNPLSLKIKITPRNLRNNN